jgi:hypothetical protein
MSKTKFGPLLSWRLKTLKGAQEPAKLADSLSCENLPDIIVPANLRPLVTAFRHLRQDARVRAVRNEFNLFYKPKNPAPAKEAPPIFAVCGYLSQKCSSMKEAREWLDDRLLRCTYPRGFIVDGRVTVVEKNFKGLKSMVMR